MGSIKITDLAPHSGELSDNDQFVIVDTSDTDGPNSSTSGKTTRLSAEKIKTSLQGEKGERGDPGLQGISPTFSYDESTGVLTITTQ